MERLVLGVFVYGTLKRGQCREACWPLPPTSVRVGWTRGFLFGGDDYPAMTPGVDRVLGELWCYAASQLPPVLEVLDAIEQTKQPGLEDLYTREIVEIFNIQGRSLGNAFTYHYAGNLMQDGFTKIQMDEDAFTRWPGN